MKKFRAESTQGMPDSARSRTFCLPFVIQNIEVKIYKIKIVPADILTVTYERTSSLGYKKIL